MPKRPIVVTRLEQGQSRGYTFMHCKTHISHEFSVYLLYSVATLLALVALSPYFLYQALRHNKYVGSLGQRLGYLPVSFNLDAEESIWVHAVSVGEVLAARPIVSGLRARYPELRVFLSTTTLSGQQLAREACRTSMRVFYFPFDWTFTVRRTLEHREAALFVMVETEIWPNLLRECRRRGIKTALVNGRISHRSFPRYRLIRPFIRRVLGDIDRFCVQGEETARRLRQARRRSGSRHGHRQPEVRLARSVNGAGSRPRARAALLPHLAGPPRARRRQHVEGRRGSGDPRVQSRANDSSRAATRC